MLQVIDFYLIRHAEAEINLVDVVSGRSNESLLTSKGVEQAKKLRDRLFRRVKNYDGADVIISPALRCKETHELSFGNDLYEINPLLQELDQGVWVGRPRKEVYTSEVLEKIAIDPWNFKAPEGESQHEVADRSKILLRKIINERYLGDILLFTHGGTIKYCCADLFNWDKREVWKIPVDNASITHIKYSDERFELMEFNSLT